MKRALIIAVLVVGCVRFAGADSAWQYARIAEMKKSTSSYTKAWVGNSPVMEERTTYTISVQAGNSLLVGTYDISEQQAAPPLDWVKGYAVKVQTDGDSLYLQSVTGQLQLHLKQRKAGRPMEPLTAEEKKRLDEMDAPLQSLIGFSSEASSNTKSGSARAGARAGQEAATQAPPPPPATPTTGAVHVQSTPYLSEVFVDGNLMGYTPAKITLPPGKHTFRLEKPGYKAWTKEMVITVGSEFALDASLEKK